MSDINPIINNVKQYPKTVIGHFKIVLIAFVFFSIQACSDHHKDDHHGHDDDADSTAFINELDFDEIESEIQSKGNDQPIILASVHPIGLIASMIANVNDISVLVPAQQDPHDFALRRSDVSRLAAADIVIWAGEDNEPYLLPFADRWPHQTWINLSQMPVDTLSDDLHWWLSYPVVNKVIEVFAERLGVNPLHAQQQLASDQAIIRQQLQTVQSRGFIVYHPAFDHWVKDYQLNQLGTLTETHHTLGLKSKRQLRQLISSGQVSCIFTEPGFNLSIVNHAFSMAANVEMGRQELDPLGRHVPLSADGYAIFIRDLADRLTRCLEENPQA